MRRLFEVRVDNQVIWLCRLPGSGENQTERCNMKKKIAVMLAGTALRTKKMKKTSTNEETNQ